MCECNACKHVMNVKINFWCSLLIGTFEDFQTNIPIHFLCNFYNEKDNEIEIFIKLCLAQGQ